MLNEQQIRELLEEGAKRRGYCVVGSSGYFFLRGIERAFRLVLDTTVDNPKAYYDELYPPVSLSDLKPGIAVVNFEACDKCGGNGGYYIPKYSPAGYLRPDGVYVPCDKCCIDHINPAPV